MRGPLVESAKSMKTFPTSGSSVAIVRALGPNSRRPALLSTSVDGWQALTIALGGYWKGWTKKGGKRLFQLTCLLHADCRLGQRRPPWLAPDPVAIRRGRR